MKDRLLIGNDVSRCNNDKCKRRIRCARYQQLMADMDCSDTLSYFSATTFDDKECKYLIQTR